MFYSSAGPVGWAECNEAQHFQLQNKVSLARRLIESGSRPRRRDTFLCSAKEKYPKERRIGCRLNPAFLAFTGGCQKGHPWPSVNVRPPCRTPDGLFPPKAPVLGAANGIQTVLQAGFLRYSKELNYLQQHLNIHHSCKSCPNPDCRI